MAFNAAGLGEEEIADHGDVVRHFDTVEEPEERPAFPDYRVDAWHWPSEQQ